jgi:AcrR family transcriptional regulator
VSAAEPIASRADRTRARIVEAGFLLVRRVGIRHLAMDAVAEEAGVSRAALYRYFANKQALVDEVLEENARRWRHALGELLAGKRTLASKVGAAARFGHFPPEDLLLLALAETDPESLALLLTTGAHRFLERAIRFWTPHVAEAKERGEIGRSVDPRQGAEWIARSFYSLSTIPAMTFDAGDPAALERYARSFILGGLRDK